MIFSWDKWYLAWIDENSAGVYDNSAEIDEYWAWIDKNSAEIGENSAGK